MRKILALLLMGGYLITMAGCNTVEGMGEDIEASGEAIEEEAEEND